MFHGIVSGVDAVAERVDGIDGRQSRTIGGPFAEVGSAGGNGCPCLSIHQVNICQAHIGEVGLEGIVPIIPPITLVALVRNEFLDEIARAAAVVDFTHGTSCVKVTILQFLLLCRQVFQTEHIVETVEHDVVIETWVAVLVGMLGVPTRLGVEHILAITHEVDGLAVGHSVLVDDVGCGVMDDVVVLHKTCHLRTKEFSAVPVGFVHTRISATEDGLGRTWHGPLLRHCIEDVGVACLSIVILRVVVDIRILELCQFVSHLTFVHQVERFAKGLGSLPAVVHVIVVGLAVGTGTQEVGSTGIEAAVRSLGLLKLLHERRASPQIALAQVAERHELVDTQVVLSSLHTGEGLVPVQGEKVVSAEEVFGAAVGTFLEGKAGKFGNLCGIKSLVDVWKSTEVAHQFEMPPSAEEIHLSEQEVALLIGANKRLDILYTHVALTDAVP